MYQIKYGGALLYDPRVESLLIDSGSCRMAVNEAGSMTFEINSQHPLYDRISPRQGVVELLSDGMTVFRGRILKVSYDFYNMKSVEVEGLLAQLNDSVIPPFEFPTDWDESTDYQTAEESGNVVGYFLSWVLSQHNAQVTEAQQIKLGTVTVKDSNNYIYRSAENYATTWDTVKEKLFDSSLGGYLLARYEADGVYVDYVDELPLTNAQAIEFGENLLDLADEADTTETYTAILPIGADGLTIADLDDGEINTDLVKEGAIIYSKSARAKYGNVTAIKTWDDVTKAKNLRTKAASMLAKTGVKLTETVSATAVDLGLVDDQIAQFRAGRLCRVKSSPHGLEDTFPLTELEIDLVSPDNTQITLGITKLSMSERQRADTAGVKQTIELQQGQIANVNSQLTKIYTEVSTSISEVEQTSTEIKLSVTQLDQRTSDYDQFKTTTSSTFDQLADEIDLRVTKETYSESYETQQAQISEIQKYFRFTEDGLYIGESGNELELRVDNGIIGFYDNGLEVAYFTNKKLVVTTADFLKSVQIGDFKFVPRKSKNLSLIKDGD